MHFHAHNFILRGNAPFCGAVVYLYTGMQSVEKTNFGPVGTKCLV